MSIIPTNGYLLVKPYSPPKPQGSSSLFIHSTTPTSNLKAFEVLEVAAFLPEEYCVGEVVYVDATYAPKTTEQGHVFIHSDHIVGVEEIEQ